ncbi:vp39 [Antheraea pernyi nucleopolyhedrovirus]|uniref:Major viral capsid protein n=2 Tax=Antheraea pernyi nuclear polyhedrosis virus TaxID=161494 RepID=Q1HH30_NPVAP|nr:vp39 [Antheraea pernyi nucleopolyhedrovirus]AWD33587.1 major viral capsid protein [Antheraea proylei nucleopolyhedrovirus]ABF50303.1 vp39 [Antheraea pernyi nucleopolyhedrovirus]ABQ12295.1 major viral capsid protein [Antheraea pernyi nucleopolyhedrovirus]AYW35414.1 vp39 [Antheraea proylei nucleopolyhedrovirus]BAX08839.1 major viral capsid protein [Antheraea pernyi nucleopolyhedrovirus]
MALVFADVSSRRSTNHCIFGGIEPFDSCVTYRSPCSSDASVDDGWFICDYHLKLRFKMAKMVLPIFDEDDNQYKRTVARHLVGHKETGDKRILVPTATNYTTVFNLSSMMLSEQLIFHLIYNNQAEIERICTALRNNENFMENTYSVVENVYSATRNILALTDPLAYCSRVANDDVRFFTINNAGNQPGNADTVFSTLPGFLRNLIRRAVAPETLQIDNEDLRLRNCNTCVINDTGLVATVSGSELYNPVRSADIIKTRPNRLQIRNVLKFEGDTRALERTLGRYEEYPLYVPLFLGYQLVNLQNNILRANNFAPAAPGVPAAQPAVVAQPAAVAPI